MRILNRPMFKYGGPIKEGVMHGMRNNYQSGQLVRPGPGRPGYQGEGFWQKLGAQYKPKNLFKWSRLNPFKKLKTLTKVPQIVKGIPKNLQGIFTQTGKTSGITGSPAATTFMQNLRSFPGASKIGGWATKAKDIALKYPKSTAAGVLYGGVPLATNLPYKKIASTIADIAVPDQIYNWETGRWFNSDDTDLKPSDKKILEQKKTEIVASAKPEHLGLEPYTDPDKAKKLAKQKQNERLKSYLDMMGYDRSKRTAIGDALIDASAIVQEGTEEAGSLKEADWGKMINKAIQTTGKRLDKPEQIREAVGLMMTKGAIEKDIAEGKDSAYDKQIESIAANLNISKKVAQKMVLNKPTSLREQVTYDVGVSKQNLTHDSLTSAVKKWYPDAIPLMNTTEVKKELGDQSAEDFIIDKIKADPPGGEGIYIVGKEVVKVDGNGNTSTIFP